MSHIFKFCCVCIACRSCIMQLLFVVLASYLLFNILAVSHRTPAQFQGKLWKAIELRSQSMSTFCTLSVKFQFQSGLLKISSFKKIVFQLYRLQKVSSSYLVFQNVPNLCLFRQKFSKCRNPRASSIKQAVSNISFISSTSSLVSGLLEQSLFEKLHYHQNICQDLGEWKHFPHCLETCYD